MLSSSRNSDAILGYFQNIENLRPGPNGYKYAFVWLLFLLLGCNRYLDAIDNSDKEVNTEHYNFLYKKDYNCFEFKGDMQYRADNQVFYSRHFKINLPKKLQRFKIGNGSSFVFEFSAEQKFFIDLDISGRQSLNCDTLYFVNNPDVLGFDMESERVVFKKKRVSLIYKKGITTFFLNNIKLKNLNEYIDFIKTMEFI
jgi:hypothetical protein